MLFRHFQAIGDGTNVRANHFSTFRLPTPLCPFYLHIENFLFLFFFFSFSFPFFSSSSSSPPSFWSWSSNTEVHLFFEVYICMRKERLSLSPVVPSSLFSSSSSLNFDIGSIIFVLGTSLSCSSSPLTNFGRSTTLHWICGQSTLGIQGSRQTCASRPTPNQHQQQGNMLEREEGGETEREVKKKTHHCYDA